MAYETVNVGIQLGYHNACIGICANGAAHVVPNRCGSFQTPCAVWIDKWGIVRVGAEAARHGANDAENAEFEFKFRMGLGVDGKKKVFARSKREMLSEELSAEVLKSLKMDVQTNVGEQLRACYSTVVFVILQSR